MPHIARAGAGPDPVGGTRDIGPCHRWAPGHGDDLYTCRAMPGRRPTGPSRWMASRCVTGRSERTLAEPPFGALAAAFVTLSLGTDRKSTRLNSSHRCISYAV